MSKIELLQKELDIIQFPYKDLEAIHPDIIEILCKAIYLEPHENKDPYWGVFLTDKEPDAHQYELIVDFKDSYCDGKKAFAFRLKGNEEFQTISFTKNMLDLDLLSMCEDKEKCIITRQGNALKIYYDNKIYLCENRNWKIFDKIDVHVQKITNHYPAINGGFIKDLLGFSFYELSINNIGATIILWFDDEFKTDYSAIADSMELNFNNFSHKELLTNYLRNNDGAVIINQNGTIIGGQSHLTFSEKSRELIYLQNKGTRHNSAARFSFDNPKSIVVTISEDGPVSVFSDGQNITELSSTDPSVQNQIIHEIAKENDSHSYEDKFEVTCKGCGKTYVITALTVSGWKENEHENCSICGQIIHSQRCFTIDSKLIKKI